MKRLKTFLICMTLLGSFSDATERKNTKQLQIITLEQAIAMCSMMAQKDKNQALESLSVEDKMRYFLQYWDPNIVIWIQKGKTYPIKLSLDGDFFSLILSENSTSSLYTNDDLFIKREGEDFLFSKKDCMHWEHAKQFFQGNCFITVEPKKLNPIVHVGANIHKRTS